MLGTTTDWHPGSFTLFQQGKAVADQILAALANETGSAGPVISTIPILTKPSHSPSGTAKKFAVFPVNRSRVWPLLVLIDDLVGFFPIRIGTVPTLAQFEAAKLQASEYQSSGSGWLVPS